MASILKMKRKEEPKKDQFNTLFFNGLKLFIAILLLLGIMGIVLIMASGMEGAIFKSIGLGIAIIWACIFLAYFVWAIYFYNINFGKTDYEWEKIYQAKEMKKLGLRLEDDDEIEEPRYNPNKDETFGLPNGTVRGMIAFTLLFGAIAMLIISMGMNSELDRNSFFWDHFEFYKTAFLMMIAFYFGSRSLQYLQKRWQTPPQETAHGHAGRQKIRGEDEVSENSCPDELPAAPISPTYVKRILQTSEKEEEKPLLAIKEEERQRHLEQEYKQIRDLKFEKYLGDDQIAEAARDNNLEFAALKAVIQVETAGRGFLTDGRPKILFEGHKFWEHLQSLGIKPEEKLPGNEDILYPKWTRKHYLGGAREYERLNKAMLIHWEAAVCSTSWGLFQIMGENVKKSPGYIKRHHDVLAFYEAQHLSEYEHLLDFLDFIHNKKIKDQDGQKKPLIEYLRFDTRNWARFAYGYNGAGYKQNAYDIKLKKAYEKFKSADYELLA